MDFFNKPHLQDHSPQEKQSFVFRRENYKWMFIGIGFIILGYLLMLGGASEDPNVFNPEIYSFRRIRLAPTLVLIGLGIQIYAILLKPKKAVEPIDTNNSNKTSNKKKK